MSKNKSDLIDIAGLLRTYASKWYWFVISVICCCALGFLYSRTVKPEYEVRANIMLTEDSTGSLMSRGLSGVGDLFGSNANATDEVEIIMSHTILRNVVKEMQLNRHHSVKLMPLVHRFAYNNFPVDIIPDESIDLDTLRNGLIFKVKVKSNGKADLKMIVRKHDIVKEKNLTLPHTFDTPYGKFTLLLTPDYEKGKEVNSIITISNFDVSAEALRSTISAGLASKHSQIITLQMITDNEKYAIDLLNNLMEAYNARSIVDQEDHTTATAQFLDDRIKDLRTNLNYIESEMSDYKENNKIVNLSEDATTLYEQMKEFENQRQEAEINLRMAELTLRMVRESATDNSLLPLQSSEVYNKLITNYNNLIIRRMRMAESAREDNPSMLALDEDIRVARANLISTIEGSVERMRQGVKELNDRYDNSNAQFAGIPTQVKTFYAMERERKIQESIYLFLRQKQEETAIMLSNIKPNAVIVDAAYSMNEDMSISTKAILFIAFVFGLIIPPVVIFALGFFRNKFQTIDEVEERVDIPVLGEICQDKSGKTLVVEPGQHSSSAELFRLVRTNLQFIMRGVSDKVVLVTSTTSGEGKSFISVNMAASMALMGKRTLLIGMDIRRPRLAEYLNLHPKFGLTQYLANPAMTVDDIIQPDAVMPGFDVIVAGPVPPNPAEMLASHSVDELFDQLRERYDYIIIDAAPVGLVSDTFLLSRLANATIYVVRAGFTKFSDLDVAAKINETQRLPGMALVVNGTKTRTGYGYGYGTSSDK